MKKRKKICLTIILSFVERINYFNNRIIDNVCNIINNNLKYYKLNIQFNYRYTTMLKIVTLLTNHNNTRLN